MPPRAISINGQGRGDRDLEQAQLQMFGSAMQTFIKQCGVDNYDPTQTIQEPNAVAPLSLPLSADAQDGPRPPSPYEKALEELCDIREAFAQSFLNINHDPAMARFVRTAIHKLENSIRRLGGEIDPFNEIEYMSSLAPASGPDESALLVNAERVVENTKKSYRQKDGFDIQVMKTQVAHGRPSVLIKVGGTDNGKKVEAYAQIVASTDFSGNEAIDYARRGAQQVFSVRAFQLGHWRDVSDNYEIAVVLGEPKSQQPAQPVQPKN